MSKSPPTDDPDRFRMPAPVVDLTPEVFANLCNRLDDVQRHASINGLPWRIGANAGNPLLYGGAEGRGALLAYGTIGSWKEFDLAVAAVNALPALLEAIDKRAAASGWIVGASDGKRWRTWASGMSAWTEDREQATRYARRKDAEAVHAEDEDAWRVEPFAGPADEAWKAELERDFTVLRKDYNRAALIIERLREACTGIDDDFMTSEAHHPGYVLIPTKKFEAICTALSEPQEQEASRG